MNIPTSLQMRTNVFSRLELLFWNLAIRTLSRSRMTRSFLRSVYGLVSATQAVSLVILMVVAGCAGLLSGTLFYYLTTSLR